MVKLPVKSKTMQVAKKNCLGIDVSKLWFDVSLIAVVKHVKQPMLTERFDNTAGGLKTFKTWLKTQSVAYDDNSLIVIENTGIYHRLIRSFCSSHNLPLHIGNAAQIKWSLGITRGKNDVIDSQRLCLYCCKGGDEPKATPALNPVFTKLKDGMSSRSRLVVQLHSTNNFADKISGKQLCSYAGVVPFANTSGTSIKGKNKVHKMANKELKKCCISVPLPL